MTILTTETGTCQLPGESKQIGRLFKDTVPTKDDDFDSRD
jgi:hypothetical protein